jgi:hypothetical protein
MNRRDFLTLSMKIAGALALLPLSRLRAILPAEAAGLDDPETVYITADRLSRRGHRYMTAWCKRHGIDPYRTYIVAILPRYRAARVYQYLYDQSGHVLLNRAHNEAARAKPFIVRPISLPVWSRQYGAAIYRGTVNYGPFVLPSRPWRRPQAKGEA